MTGGALRRGVGTYIRGQATDRCGCSFPCATHPSRCTLSQMRDGKDALSKTHPLPALNRRAAQEAKVDAVIPDEPALVFEVT